MPPLLRRELRDGDEALPIGVSARDGRGGQDPIPAAALVPAPRALGLRLGRGQGVQDSLGLGLVLRRDGTKYITNT